VVLADCLPSLLPAAVVALHCLCLVPPNAGDGAGDEGDE